MLGNWNGELKYMSNFKFRRFGKKHLNEALLKANKESKESKDMQTKIQEKAENPSKEIRPKNNENLLSKSTDLDGNNQSIDCNMEIE